MRMVGRWRRWAAASNEQALRNAREASTTLSRARVEREEVELYLARHDPAQQPALVTDARVAGGAR
jgi:hypothetical protein